MSFIPPGQAPRPHDASEEALVARFLCHEATVAVLGLGYVGLPLVRAIAARGFRVLGLDRDAGRVAQLAGGGSPLRHLPAGAFAPLVQAGQLSFTTEEARLASADAILICVPTPLGPGREPDLSCVEEACRSVARHLRRGQLVVLESTTWPGTCADVAKPLLEASGLSCGRDFHLAYSPEREDPGNLRFGTADIPKVVGGDGPVAQRLALALYGEVVAATVPVSSMATAEAVKLTENVFRAVNIALVNELKLLFDGLGLDVWEVIEAARTKPFGYMAFWPGPGTGGHCIPVDPEYLAWKARAHGLPARFIELAGEVNADMRRFALRRLEAGLLARGGKPLAGSRVLVVGAAYKPGVADCRESPALHLLEMLEAEGAAATFHDPLVPSLPAILPEHPALAGRQGLGWEAALAGGFDAAIIVTDQPGVDYAALVDGLPLVVDTRNACASRGLSAPHVLKA